MKGFISGEIIANVRGKIICLMDKRWYEQPISFPTSCIFWTHVFNLLQKSVDPGRMLILPEAQYLSGKDAIHTKGVLFL